MTSDLGTSVAKIRLNCLQPSTIVPTVGYVLLHSYELIFESLCSHWLKCRFFIGLFRANTDSEIYICMLLVSVVLSFSSILLYCERFSCWKVLIFHCKNKKTSFSPSWNIFVWKNKDKMSVDKERRDITARCADDLSATLLKPQNSIRGRPEVNLSAPSHICARRLW